MGKLFLVTIVSLLVSCTTSERQDVQLVGWGDSMMKGSGGKKSILKAISENLDNIEFTNYGVGGLQSSSVAVLQGGLPLQLKFDKERLPYWGSTAESEYYNLLPYNDQTKPYRKGRIGNNKGKLIRNPDPNNPKIAQSFTFKNQALFKPLTLKDTVVFVFEDAIQKNNAITIIWAGRNDKKAGNNSYQTRDNIKAMIDYLNPESRDKVLILSICNGIGDNEYRGSTPHTEILRLNVLLQESFGDSFIDLRTYMVKKAIYDMGMTPTSKDIEDMNKDCIPRSLLSDHVHFNSLGYEAAGKYLAQVIKDKEWIN